MFFILVLGSNIIQYKNEISWEAQREAGIGFKLAIGNKRENFLKNLDEINKESFNKYSLFESFNPVWSYNRIKNILREN